MPHPNALLDPRKEESIIRTAKMKTISPLITFDCCKFTSFPLSSSYDTTRVYDKEVNYVNSP